MKVLIAIGKALVYIVLGLVAVAAVVFGPGFTYQAMISEEPPVQYTPSEYLLELDFDNFADLQSPAVKIYGVDCNGKFQDFVTPDCPAYGALVNGMLELGVKYDPNFYEKVWVKFTGDQAPERYNNAFIIFVDENGQPFLVSYDYWLTASFTATFPVDYAGSHGSWWEIYGQFADTGHVTNPHGITGTGWGYSGGGGYFGGETVHYFSAGKVDWLDSVVSNYIFLTSRKKFESNVQGGVITAYYETAITKLDENTNISCVSITALGETQTKCSKVPAVQGDQLEIQWWSDCMAFPECVNIPEHQWIRFDDLKVYIAPRED